MIKSNFLPMSAGTQELRGERSHRELLSTRSPDLILIERELAIGTGLVGRQRARQPIARQRELLPAE
jgi:hypothetical protein